MTMVVVVMMTMVVIMMTIEQRTLKSQLCTLESGVPAFDRSISISMALFLTLAVTIVIQLNSDDVTDIDLI